MTLKEFAQKSSCYKMCAVDILAVHALLEVCPHALGSLDHGRGQARSLRHPGRERIVRRVDMWPSTRLVVGQRVEPRNRYLRERDVLDGDDKATK